MIEQRIDELTRANQAFYDAFESLDIGRMDKVWAHQEYVTCIHPRRGLRKGWPSVSDSWVLIFNHTFSMKFRLREVFVQVAGDMGWVICTENLTTEQEGNTVESRVLATNLFERVGEEWVLIHHHGSPVMGGG